MDNFSFSQNGTARPPFSLDTSVRRSAMRNSLKVDQSAATEYRPDYNAIHKDEFLLQVCRKLNWSRSGSAEYQPLFTQNIWTSGKRSGLILVSHPVFAIHSSIVMFTTAKYLKIYFPLSCRSVLSLTPLSSSDKYLFFFNSKDFLHLFQNWREDGWHVDISIHFVLVGSKHKSCWSLGIK